MFINSLCLVVSWRLWSTMIQGRQKYRYIVLFLFELMQLRIDTTAIILLVPHVLIFILVLLMFRESFLRYLKSYSDVLVEMKQL